MVKECDQLVTFWKKAKTTFKIKCLQNPTCNLSLVTFLSWHRNSLNTAAQHMVTTAFLSCKWKKSCSGFFTEKEIEYTTRI